MDFRNLEMVEIGFFKLARVCRSNLKEGVHLWSNNPCSPSEGWRGKSALLTLGFFHTWLDWATECKCKRCNRTGSSPSILRHTWIWEEAHEAVMNIVQKIGHHYRKNWKKNLLLYENQIKGSRKTDQARGKTCKSWRVWNCLEMYCIFLNL